MSDNCSPDCVINTTSDEPCPVCHHAGCECGPSCQCKPVDCQCGPDCQCARHHHAANDELCATDCECWKCQLSRQREVLPSATDEAPVHHEHLPDSTRPNRQNEIDQEMADKHDREQQGKKKARKAHDDYVRYVLLFPSLCALSLSLSLSLSFSLSLYIYTCLTLSLHSFEQWSPMPRLVISDDSDSTQSPLHSPYRTTSHSRSQSQTSSGVWLDSAHGGCLEHTSYDSGGSGGSGVDVSDLSHATYPNLAQARAGVTEEVKEECDKVLFRECASLVGFATTLAIGISSLCPMCLCFCLI